MFVIAGKANQLGNRLFLFAHLIGSAIGNGVPVVNAGFAEYAEYFQTTAQDLYCRFPAQRSLVNPTKARRQQFDQLIFRLSSSFKGGRLKLLTGRRVRVIESGFDTTLTNPGGWFDLQNPAFVQSLTRDSIVFFRGPLIRDYGNFNRSAAQLRDYFKPLDQFEKNSVNVILHARETGDVIIGVHIRQRDYRQFVGGRYFYSLEQYIQLMRQVETLFAGQRVTFLLCTDEPQLLPEDTRLNLQWGSGHFIEDLYTLSKCDFIMGPPSSFSLWASFYGEVPRFEIVDIHKPPLLQDFCFGPDKPPEVLTA